MFDTKQKFDIKNNCFIGFSENVGCCLSDDEVSTGKMMALATEFGSAIALCGAGLRERAFELNRISILRVL